MKRKDEEVEVETEAELSGLGSICQLTDHEPEFKGKLRRNPKIGFDLEEIQGRNKE